VQIDNTLLNIQGVKKVQTIKGKIPRDNENKTQFSKTDSHSEIRSPAQREIYTPPHLCAKSSKIFSTKMKHKPKPCTRKETIKIMAEINQVENRKQNHNQ
jgi:hypothetical protein